MRFGIHLPQFGRAAGPEAIRRAAVLAEDLGFDDVWVSDHVAQPASQGYPSPYLFDPFLSLTWAAAATERVGLGTSVLVAAQYHPLWLANVTASLDALSGGRLRLGVGVGWSEAEYQALGQDFHTRGRRTDEILEILEACWTTDPTSYAGAPLPARRHAGAAQARPPDRGLDRWGQRGRLPARRPVRHRVPAHRAEARHGGRAHRPAARRPSRSRHLHRLAAHGLGSAGHGRRRDPPRARRLRGRRRPARRRRAVALRPRRLAPLDGAARRARSRSGPTARAGSDPGASGSGPRRGRPPRGDAITSEASSPRVRARPSTTDRRRSMARSSGSGQPCSASPLVTGSSVGSASATRRTSSDGDGPPQTAARRDRMVVTASPMAQAEMMPKLSAASSGVKPCRTSTARNALGVAGDHRRADGPVDELVEQGRVGDERRPVVGRPLEQPDRPVLAVVLGQRQPPGGAVGRQAQQVVLAVDVVVERGHRDPEVVGDGAEGELGQPDLDGGVGDLLATDARGATAARPGVRDGVGVRAGRRDGGAHRAHPTQGEPGPAGKHRLTIPRLVRLFYQE